MKHKMTSTHIWIKATAVFIVLPLYLSIIFGMLRTYDNSVNPKMFWGIMPVGILLAILLSFFLLIRSGKLAVPVIVMLALTFGISMIRLIPGFKKIAQPKRTWTIEGYFKIPGIDVYCNGVHLGQTPLTITEKEFYTKVKPWNTPPRQDRTTLREDDHDENSRFGWGCYMWIPSDFIEYTKNWPDNEKPLWHGIPENVEFFEFCKKTPYWWRFEKDGCIVLSKITSLLGWGGGGNATEVKLSTDVSVQFPSLDKHFKVVIADLKRNNWQPSEAWMNHFDTYKDLLFGKLYEYAQKHKQAKPALDAVVRREMNIPSGELSEPQRREVLEDVFRRAEEKSEFRIPSFESEAALLACQDMPEMIGEYYHASSGYGRGGRVSGGDSYTRYANSGRTVRAPIMRWLVSQYQPPQLYNQLVYLADGNESVHRQWLGQTDLKLLLNYPRPESEKILNHYLKSLQNKKPNPFGRAHDNDDIIRFLTKIHNPILEPQIRRFVQNNPGRGGSQTEQFVRSRVKLYPTDPHLPGWILHYTQMRDYEKARLIVQLRTKEINHHLNYLCSGSQGLRGNVLEGIKDNPFGDEFIVNSYKYYDMQNPRRSMCGVVWALVRIDTPVIREFVTEIWDKGPQERKTFMKRLRQCGWQQPNMEWMVPMIAELTDSEEQSLGMNLLTRIGTPTAKELLDKWSKDPDNKNAALAERYLKELTNEKSKSNAEIVRIDQLLSGQIKPDDLLAPAPAYIWDGEKYVPEQK